MRVRIAALAAAAALLATGCSATLAGEAVRGATGVLTVPTASGSSTTGGSTVPSATTPPQITTPQFSSAGPTGDTSAGPPPTSPPAPPVPSSTSPASAGVNPVRDFDGARQVDPASFAGAVTPVGFDSPSRNISCGIDNDSVACQLGHFSYAPTPSGDCHGGGVWGNTLRMGGAAAAFACGGGVEGGGPVLPYGSELTVGVLRCVSRPQGVTCQNTRSGYGFRVAAAEVRFFATRAGG